MTQNSPNSKSSDYLFILSGVIGLEALNSHESIRIFLSWYFKSKLLRISELDICIFPTYLETPWQSQRLPIPVLTSFMHCMQTEVVFHHLLAPYSSIYIHNKNDEKTIQKTVLDKVRIMLKDIIPMLSLEKIPIKNMQLAEDKCWCKMFNSVNFCLVLMPACP